MQLVALFFLFVSIMPVFASEKKDVQALISQALLSSPTIGYLKFQVDSDRQGVETARWNYYPTPEILFDQRIDRAENTGLTANSPGVMLTISQPLWTGGRLTAQLGQAKEQEAISTYKLEEQKITLANSVVKAFGDWVSAKRKYVAWQEGINLHKELRRQVLARIKGGVAKQADLTLVDMRIDSMKSDSFHYVSQMNVAEAELSNLMNQKVDANYLQGVAQESKEVKIHLNDLLSEAIAISPKLKQMDSETKLKQYEADLAQSKLYPELDVSFRHERDTYHLKDFDTGVYLELKTQLGAGLSNFSEAKKASLSVLVMEKNKESVKLDLMKTVENDYIAYRTARDRIASIGFSVKSSQGVLSSYRRQYLAGTKSWLEVLNAASELANYKSALADAEAGLIVSSWQLLILTQGVGFSEK